MYLSKHCLIGLFFTATLQSTINAQVGPGDDGPLRPLFCVVSDGDKSCKDLFGNEVTEDTYCRHGQLCDGFVGPTWPGPQFEIRRNPIWVEKFPRKLKVEPGGAGHWRAVAVVKCVVKGACNCIPIAESFESVCVTPTEWETTHKFVKGLTIQAYLSWFSGKWNFQFGLVVN